MNFYRFLKGYKVRQSNIKQIQIYYKTILKHLIKPKRFRRIFPFINGKFSIIKQKKKKIALSKAQKAIQKKLNISNIDNDTNCHCDEIIFN